jgi:hypothetical protein
MYVLTPYFFSNAGLFAVEKERPEAARGWATRTKFEERTIDG